MRPLHLRLRGFGAFRDETEIDFADTDVFALVGPTGAGKSTIVDAICFALYGSVPRHGERLVDPVVSVGANEAAVELGFELAGERYVVVRVVRRTGREARVTTKEARLERHHADGTIDLLAGSARDLLPAVEQLLGLTFTHFTRCVVLPQGEFARFLHDKPADRQTLLERLLGLGLYDVMVKEANQRAAEARALAGAIERRGAELPPHTDDMVATATAHLDEVRRLVVSIEAAQAELAALRAAAAEAGAAADEATALATVLGRIAIPAVVAELGDRLAEGRLAVASALAAHEEAVRRVADARDRLASYPPLDSLEAATQAHLRLAKGRDVREQRAEAVDAAVEAQQAAMDAAGRAEAAQEAARLALDAVRRQHAAHDLAGNLVAGEPCPVCRQVVAAVPRRVRLPALKAAEDALVGAERALRAARQEATAATAEERDAATELARVDATLGALAEQVAAFPDPEALAAQLADIAAAATELAGARDKAAVADGALTAARGAVTQFETGLTQAGDLFHAQRDAVAAAGPPAPGSDLVSSWQALVAWAAEHEPVVLARAEDRLAAGAAATTRFDDLTAQLAKQADAAGVRLVGGAADARADVARAEERAEQAVTALRAACAAAERLEAEADVVRHRHRVAHELGRHLSASGFPRWLVLEALDLLVADASLLLRRLSNGQYSLVAVDDGSGFGVIDHANANEIRPVRSLSGGETFQASLAFALALSDHVASLTGAGGARLDAIFLDEGFGTLDADSLETVAATIESLAGGGRMVGIVTHVRELAERVPVRYVVRKGPRTATVTRVVA